MGHIQGCPRFHPTQGRTDLQTTWNVGNFGTQVHASDMHQKERRDPIEPRVEGRDEGASSYLRCHVAISEERHPSHLGRGISNPPRTVASTQREWATHMQKRRVDGTPNSKRTHLCQSIRNVQNATTAFLKQQKLLQIDERGSHGMDARSEARTKCLGQQGRGKKGRSITSIPCKHASPRACPYLPRAPSS